MRRRRFFTLALFSALPTCVLLLGAELLVRAWSLDRPSFLAGGSGLGPDSLVAADRRLGWALKPDMEQVATYADGRRIVFTTNSLGLRSPEVLPKEAGEFRILSLGESTTFGIGVSDRETYSFLLQEDLRARYPGRRLTVVNAGVSAYSSFQSLRYLREKGLELDPDLVLFYHEVNDYLPSSVRDTEMNEVGILKTDRQLYSSRLYRLNLFFTEHSALYRLLSGGWARRKIKAIRKQDFKNRLYDIGLKIDRFDSSHVSVIEGERRREVPGQELNAISLGQRVSEEERLENLTELLALSRKRGIRLVVMHPAYRYSARHECLLTRFCRENGVLMFEAFDSLRPRSAGASLFLDLWHPTAAGHATLAGNLAEYLAAHQLLTRD